MEPEQRVPAAPGLADADRAGRPARLRLRVGGRAPLPRGVLALARRPRSSSAPPASARKRIRLGHGIVQLPTNHPIRVAERVSTLDLLTGGRVELGLGEGQGPVELHPFGRRVRDKREVWEEAVRALVPCFTQQLVGVARPVLRLRRPQRDPQAVAEAAPAAVGGLLEHPDHRQRRAAGGWERSAFSSSRPRRRARGCTEYYTKLTQNLDKLADYPVNPNIAMVSALHVRADRRGGPRAGGGLDVLRLLPLATTDATACPTPGEGNMWEAYQEWRHTRQGAGDAAQRAHRLARDDPRAAARVRGHRRGSGDPARTRPGARPTTTSARASSCSRATSCRSSTRASRSTSGGRPTSWPAASTSRR